MKQEDRGLLEAALLGYNQQVLDINAKITALNARLNIKSPSVKTGAHKRHRISPEGRARIAAAQRKRWAARKKAGA
jgi:hypothetical protein